MHLQRSQALVLRRSMRKPLGIEGKGNSRASPFLKIPVEVQPCQEPGSPPLCTGSWPLHPQGVGSSGRFLLFVQGP